MKKKRERKPIKFCLDLRVVYLLSERHRWERAYFWKIPLPWLNREIRIY